MSREKHRRAAFAPGAGFYVWLALLAFSVVMTQALRSSVSGMLLWFAALVLPAAVLQVLIGFLTVRVYVNAGQTRTEKQRPLEYEVSIVNGSPLCFPTMEAVISVPQRDGVRCTSQRLVLCLLPLGNYEIRHTTGFRYRGTYQIGVECLYISDLFHLFRIRRRVDLYQTVLVLPRRLPLEDRLRASVSELPSQASRRIRGDDQSEIGEVREYRAGDPLKAVHWKLSSKAQDLLVKEFETDQTRRVYVLCDYSGVREVLPPPPSVTETRAKPRRKIRLRGQEKNSPAARRAARLEKKRQKLRGESPENAPEVRRRAEPGSAVKPEYRAEINELCADGVAEAAVAAVFRELQRGNVCTLVWYDRRIPEAPVRSAEIASAADFEDIFVSFATTPDCPPEADISRLALRITDHANVTVRIVTAKVDEMTLDACVAIPAMLGGAGIGCATEVLLFNPEERYESPQARRGQVAAVRERLQREGVSVREICRAVNAGGTEILMADG